MSNKTDQSSDLKNKKKSWIIIILFFFFVELCILIISFHYSGNRSRLQIMDQDSNIVYEIDGSRLSDFDKYYFEKAFGPIQNYRLKLKTQIVPFPFRAWIVTAIGVPIGIVLLIAFIYKSLNHLLDSKKGQSVASESQESTAKRLVNFYEGIRHANIFILGILVFITILSYWVIPNLLTDVGKIVLQIIKTYPWFFFVSLFITICFFMWIVYLKYLLAQKAIESQVELKKFQLKLAYAKDMESAKQIGFETIDHIDSDISIYDSQETQNKNNIHD